MTPASVVEEIKITLSCDGEDVEVAKTVAVRRLRSQDYNVVEGSLEYFFAHGRVYLSMRGLRMSSLIKETQHG